MPRPGFGNPVAQGRTHGSSGAKNQRRFDILHGIHQPGIDPRLLQRRAPFDQQRLHLPLCEPFHDRPEVSIGETFDQDALPPKGFQMRPRHGLQPNHYDGAGPLGRIDATVGQNGLAQAREFQQASGANGIVLTKLDGTAKGGVAVAIAHDLKLPIRFVGVGEGIDDFLTFDPDAYVDAIFTA